MSFATRLIILTAMGIAICNSVVLAENGVLNIGEYFVENNVDRHDCTQTLRDAFALAGKERRSVIYFPPGNYNVSDTIDISTANKIYSDGKAVIYQKNPDKDIFVTKGKWRITVSGISFRGGKNQLVIGNPNIDQSFFIISECDFRKSSQFAIKILDGTPSAYCLVDRCTFKYSFQAFYNTCDKATFANCWISTAASNTNSAVFVNRGTLTIENLLGVPRVVGKKQRWVDNYGSIICRNDRFGGEGGGFSIVYNYAAADFKYPVIPRCVILDTCDVYCASKSAIVCHELPNKISIKDCRGFVDCRMFDFSPLGDIDTYLSPKYKYYTPVPHKPNYKLPLFFSVDKFEALGNFPVALMPYTPEPITYMGHADPDGFGAPAKGRWLRGAVVHNPNGPVRVLPNQRSPLTPTHIAIEEPYAWLCIESGIPGKWVPIGYGDAGKKNNNLINLPESSKGVTK